MRYEMTIKTVPVPKGRPRFYGNHAVTPPKTREYEKLVRQSWTHGMLEGPLQVHMMFYMPIPQSYSRKKQLELIGTGHLKKPDLDNLVKSVLDGLQGVCFENDSQVCELAASKTYEEYPMVRVVIYTEEEGE